jgi:hypothetical protein
MAKVTKGTAQVAKVNTLSTGISIASVTKQADTHLTVCFFLRVSRIEYEKTNNILLYEK